jgi:hypothetical protein
MIYVLSQEHILCNFQNVQKYHEKAMNILHGTVSRCFSPTPHYSYPNKITCTDLCIKYMSSMHMQIDLYEVHQPDSFNSLYIMFILKIKEKTYMGQVRFTCSAVPPRITHVVFQSDCMTYQVFLLETE